MPTGIEIERKYIIRMPSLSALASMDAYRESEIEQIYLPAPSGRTHRIRARTEGGKTVYTENEKIRIDRMSVIEREEEIDAARYAELAGEADRTRQPVRKKRCVFTFQNAVYEVDIYPEWQHCAILETELPDRETVREIPSVLSVLADVTGDKRYSNASMALHFPPEPGSPVEE